MFYQRISSISCLWFVYMDKYRIQPFHAEIEWDVGIKSLSCNRRYLCISGPSIWWREECVYQRKREGHVEHIKEFQDDSTKGSLCWICQAFPPCSLLVLKDSIKGTAIPWVHKTLAQPNPNSMLDLLIQLCLKIGHPEICWFIIIFIFRRAVSWWVHVWGQCGKLKNKPSGCNQPFEVCFTSSQIEVWPISTPNRGQFHSNYPILISLYPVMFLRVPYHR